MKNLSPEINLGASEAGMMDLSTFSADEGALYPLVGEWLYFSDELLTTEEIKAKRDEAQIKTYPQDWMEESVKKDYNYGTFYTELSLPDDLLRENLSLHVPKPRLALKLFIDDELVGASGNPASTIDEFEASMSPYIAHFHTEKQTIDIVLHVSNDDTTPPTPVTPIAFGTTDAIQDNKVISMVSKLIVVTAFCFILIFAIFLYFYLQANAKKIMFYLAIYMIFNILTTLLDYDQVLLLDMPFSYEIKSKMYRLSYVFTALFAFQFFRYFLAEYKTARWYHYYPYVSIGYATFVIIAPLTLIDTFSAFLLVIFLVPIIYIVVKFARALQDEAEDVELLLLMGISLLNNLLWSVYKTSTNTLTFEYYPIDVLIALFLFALYWLRKYIRHTEKIEALTEELIEKDKSKDDFLAQTSHELRNPLHSMINIAELVVQNPQNKLVQADKKSMDLLLSVGKRMSLLIDDLLDLTLLSEKRLRLEKTAVNMRTVVATVIDMLYYLVLPKNITIKNNIAHDFPAVYADESRLIQLVLNIAHNAIKYTDDGEIVITASVKDGKAWIEVRDTGRGIAPEQMDTIFEPFMKRNEVDGIGLGLQVTKELIEHHGGTIAITSELDEGTTVLFTLPLAEKSTVLVATQDIVSSVEIADESEESDIEQDIQVSKAKILLVDDDQVNVEVIAKLLQADRYEVVTALSGQEALQKMQTTPVDLVISDVMMPHMSGYELVKKIREQYAISELPIILLTARGKMTDLNAGFQVGANDYVVKPVDALELRARVKALTDLQVAVKDQLKLEAAWLQAQINPHFLYNTINSIMMMAKANPAKMQYLLEKFVYFLRTSYNFQSKESLVLLRDELQLVDAYLSIEKERFGDRLQILWGIDESLDIYIPPLSLQTLVENALKHGILNRMEGGTITLQSIEEAEYIDIIIQDDGVGMSKETIKKVKEHEFAKEYGIGLINTDKRLRKWLQTSLMIDSDVNEGTKITIRIQKDIQQTISPNYKIEM